MAKSPIHSKFYIPTNRVGALLTLDELMVIWKESEIAINRTIPTLKVSLYSKLSTVYLEVEDDLSKIIISQSHMFPRAVIYRELGNSSKVKTPDSCKILKLVDNYFNK